MGGCVCVWVRVRSVHGRKERKREPKRGRGEAGGKTDGGNNPQRVCVWLQDLQRWPRLICSIGRTARVSRPRLCALMPHPLPDWTRCQHTCDARCLVHHNVRTSTLSHACTHTHTHTHTRSHGRTHTHTGAQHASVIHTICFLLTLSSGRRSPRCSRFFISARIISYPFFLCKGMQATKTPQRNQPFQHQKIGAAQACIDVLSVRDTCQSQSDQKERRVPPGARAVLPCLHPCAQLQQHRRRTTSEDSVANQ